MNKTVEPRVTYSMGPHCLKERAALLFPECQLEIQLLPHDGGYLYRLVESDTWQSVVFQFILEDFPNCCAMLLFRDFSYNAKRLQVYDRPADTHKRFEELILNIFNYTLTGRYWGNSKRIVANFVEMTKETDERAVAVGEIEFSHYYNLFEKQDHFQEMVFPNHNTGSLIHFCEAIFD